MKALNHSFSKTYEFKCPELKQKGFSEVSYEHENKDKLTLNKAVS